MMDKESLILELYDIGAIKFGDFTLKGGLRSPIYLDLRLMVSYPKLLRQISHFLWNLIHTTSFDLIAGIPYAALPLATCISIDHSVPMVICRKEAQTHGTKKMIEGAYRPNQVCLVIEDVMTSGTSILETIENLQTEHLNVKDIVVVIDRQQGGHIHLMQKGYHLHTLFTMTEILDVLNQYQKITEQTRSHIHSHIRESLH